MGPLMGFMIVRKTAIYHDKHNVTKAQKTNPNKHIENIQGIAGTQFLHIKTHWVTL
jgi:hypothetical protein